MGSDFYLMINFDVATDDIAALTSLVSIVVKVSRAEPGCLNYAFALAPDGKTAWMIEHFADDAAFIEHATQNFSRYAAQWNALLALKSLSVIGNPGAAARALLPPDAIWLQAIEGDSN